MTECLHMKLDGAQRGRVPVSCQNPQCENCGWNPECSARRREELREKEEREELVDRELMERSLAAFEADVDAGLVDCDAAGHPVWREGQVYR